MDRLCNILLTGDSKLMHLTDVNKGRDFCLCCSLCYTEWGESKYTVVCMTNNAIINKNKLLYAHNYKSTFARPVYSSFRTVPSQGRCTLHIWIPYMNVALQLFVLAGFRLPTMLDNYVFCFSFKPLSHLSFLL